MNFTKEQLDDNTIILKVDIAKDDYLSKYEKALRDARKQASFKGFRPGKSPMGLVKKMYGSQLFIDEINKLLSEAIRDYIKNEKLSLLGEPIQHGTSQMNIDFNNPEDYTFELEMGLKPEFEVDINDEIKLPVYDLVPTKEEIDDFILNLRNKDGEVVDVEVIEDENVVLGCFFSEISADKLKEKRNRYWEEFKNSKYKNSETEVKDQDDNEADEAVIDESQSENATEEDNNQSKQEQEAKNTITEETENNKKEEENGNVSDDMDENYLEYDVIFLLQYIKDEEIRDSFMGLGLGDVTNFNPYQAIENKTELASMFRIKEKNNVKSLLDRNFNVYIDKIAILKPAELNKDFFKKTTGKDTIETYQEFEDEIKEQFIGQFKSNIDNKLFTDFKEYIIKEKALQLPDEFLKKWLLQSNEDITKKDIEEDYPDMRKNFEWTLIQNEITKKYDIEVKEKELEQTVSYLVVQDAMQQNLEIKSEEQYKNLVNQRLGNKGYVNAISDLLLESKIVELLYERIALDKKTINSAEYKKIFQPESNKNEKNAIEENNDGQDAQNENMDNSNEITDNTTETVQNDDETEVNPETKINI